MISPAAMVDGGRALAESLMLDDCHITRAGKSTGIDPDTGRQVADDPTDVYSGKCKIQSESVQSLNPVSGDHVYTVDRWMVHVPVSATGIQVGDEIEITASLMDSANVGRRFRVSGLFRKTMATAQRLPVEEVVA